MKNSLKREEEGHEGGRGEREIKNQHLLRVNYKLATFTNDFFLIFIILAQWDEWLLSLLYKQRIVAKKVSATLAKLVS